jgi:GT2 family glycosyltransferase
MGKYYKSRVGIEVVASRYDYLASLLVSLWKQTYRKWDLILVVQDLNIPNHPLIKGLLSRMIGEGHRFKVIHGGLWLGIGGLRNLAIDANDCEYGLRIDDDSICEPDFIEKLMDVMKKRCGVVGCLVPTVMERRYVTDQQKINYITDDVEIHDSSIYFFNTDKEYFDVDHVRSSYMYPTELSKRLKFPTYNDDLGGFREETDFCIRAKLEGYPISLVPTAINWHMVAPTGGTRPVWNKYGRKAVEKADERFKAKVKEYKKNKVQKHNSKGKGRKAKKV